MTNAPYEKIKKKTPSSMANNFSCEWKKDHYTLVLNRKCEGGYGVFIFYFSCFVIVWF
jgi:hypothetical protein